ncbi:hypothetical protein E4Z66_16030 [Aliishimia ponticola]|uniref:Basal-body rod modification protein FlgD n=1 Tax=Aliishimia ponticola TaxID=2499833 RepID=A0A4S4N809_9RHOB|nr:flagellar hook capping FlgD N-terminal domain-containing protein [Aliishimia ponticola]THH35324.1 hypothetical protein E4Z66_16030 [Aliishimia ponticola]
MDAVTQTSNTSSALTTSASTSVTANTEASSVISSDFETFLQMLTAQARYQDPLEPLDSSEYSGQLAQFSTVEQQVLTNDLLSALVSQMGGSEMAQVAGWIGMEARTSTPAYFDGTPIDVVSKPVTGADEVNLLVLDATGDVVQRVPMSLAADTYTWDGLDDDGEQMNAGLYSFKIESLSNEQVLATSIADTYTRVTEARTENGITKLILNGGTSVEASAITALREAA